LGSEKLMSISKKRAILGESNNIARKKRRRKGYNKRETGVTDLRQERGAPLPTE